VTLKAIADDRIQLPFVRKPDDRMYGVLWKDVVQTDEQLVPSFLWTVERDPETGEVRIVVREITRDELGLPLFSVTIDAADEDYALATAWDAADTVLRPSDRA
jgi:hypothetical protein